MDFQSHWLDYMVEGQPVREWCRCLKGDAGKARCIYCNVSVRFGDNPVMSFKKHALSRRHKQNRKKVHLGLKAPADYAIKQMRPKQTTDACKVLYPGMNFNCSVNLLPLGVLHKTSNQVRNADLVSLLQWLVRPEMKKAFIDVYICFHCGKEFASRLTLQDHQRGCNLRSPELQAVAPFGNAQLHHQYGYRTPPRCSAFYNTSGQEASRNSMTAREQVTYPSVWPSKDNFITSLGLLPKKKAAQVCSRRRYTQCESIDLDDDIPISPTLPRTPKLLISHLSRDGSEKCGDNSPSRVRKSLFSSQHNPSDEETNNSNRNDDNNEENKHEERSKISHAKSLYSLDLTSPLGQFVIKHIKGDPNLHVLSDVESHCLTSVPQVNTPAIKLRDRHITYPITFKGFSGKSSLSYIHLYKFTRQQKVEFLQRVNTGLDKRSRALLRKMKMCKVKLAHLTKADLKQWMVSSLDVTVDLKPLSAKEILFWTSPKEVPDTNSNNPAVFPRGLSFSSPNVNNVLGLKTCKEAAFCKKYNLSVANYVSEEACAEVTENRRAVYKSLLSDSTSSASGKLESENSLAFVPALKLTLISPGLHRVSQGCINSSRDFTDSKVNMASVCTYPSLSPVSPYPVDKSSSKERIQYYKVLSSVNRNTDHPGSTVVHLLALAPRQLHCVSDQATRNGSRDLTTLESIRSGIYSVHIRTALEGEAIQNSATNYQKVCDSSKASVKHSKTEQSTPERNKILNSKFLMKSFEAIKQPSDKHAVRKRHLKSTDALKAKKRKVSTKSHAAKQPQKGENSLTKVGVKIGKHISLRKYSESRKKDTLLPTDTTQAASAVQNGDQRLSTNSVCPASEKHQNPTQFMKAERTQNGVESYNCDTYNRGVSHQVKQNENSKCSGCYGKRVTVASFLNGNVENCNRCVICQHTKTDRSVHLKNLHQDLKVANGKHRCPPKLVKHSSEGTETNLTIKKSRYISHLCRLEEMERTNGIDSRSASSPAVDSKTIKIAKKSFLQVNTSTDSEVASQKDASPNGLRFVTYSSPSSPQLRQSSLINTISIPRKAEVRKSLLSSFLLKSK